MLIWHKCTDRLPPYEEDLRVLIFTQNYDFDGEQFFDVKATDLYDIDGIEYNSEIAENASHWTYLPFPDFKLWNKKY